MRTQIYAAAPSIRQTIQTFSRKPRIRENGKADSLAAALAFFAGALTEVLQHLTVRQASARDLTLDALGIPLAWARVSCWRRPGVWRRGFPALVAGCMGAAAFLIAQKADEMPQLADMMTNPSRLFRKAHKTSFL